MTFEIVEAIGQRRQRRVRAAMAISKSSRQDAQRHSILIVEDDAIMALTMNDELSALGYEVVAVTDNGREAIALARAQQPDLVILDVRLRGDTDGIATAVAITESISTQIVFVTAHVDAESRRAMAAVAYAGLLAKPYTSDQLARTVRAALED